MRLAVVQARMGSSRLPGKVLQDVGGMSILMRVVTRLRRARTVERVVVAISVSPNDDVLYQFCKRHDIDVIRGNEFDVLDRFGEVLDAFPDADEVVRITADCPFVDPDVVDDVVNAMADADFAANRLPPPYKRTYPVGLDVEVATRAALVRARVDAVDPRDREHVMPYLYTVPGRFRTRIVDLEQDYSNYRWTVDTPEDLAAMRAIAVYLPPEPFGWRDVLAVSLNHPEIAAINQGVNQKQLSVIDDRWTRQGG